MREVKTGVDSKLPEPRSSVGAAMSKDELWEAVDVLSRVMGESVRRRLPGDVFDRLDVARGVVLAMFATASSDGHSVRVVDGDAA